MVKKEESVTSTKGIKFMKKGVLIVTGVTANTPRNSVVL